MDKKIVLCMITETGCTEEAAIELKDRFGVEEVNEENDNALTFEASAENAVEIMYVSQSAKRMLFHIGTGKFKDFEELLHKISKKIAAFDLKGTLSDQTYRIECEREGDHDFNSMEVETETAALILEHANNKVDLKSADFIFHVNIIGDKFVLGIDLAGRDLSKRQYRVFNTYNAVKGTLGFSLLMFSNIKKNSSIVDPFCLSGTIPIEAALYAANFPVNHYDKRLAISKMKCFDSIDAQAIMKRIDEKISDKQDSQILCVDAQFRNIVAAKKNAKVAGIDKAISFSRNDVDWLDIKIDEKSIAILATRPIEPSKTIAEATARKAYSQLFNRSQSFLKQDAVMSFIVNNFDVLADEASKYGFQITKKKQVFQGRQPLWFISLAKN